MAVRRHVVAGLNVGKDAFSEAFADLGHVEAEVTGPWTWFMASPWAVGSDQLIERIRRVGLFFRTSTARDLRQLYEEHQTGIALLKERGFTPKRAEPTLEAFAAALADALHRRKLADL